MKKIILSAAALFVFGFASAQDAKESTGGKGFANGDVFVSGSVGFNSSSTGDFSSSSFNIMPKVGFFVTENIAVGGQIGYISTTADIFDDVEGDIVESKTNTFSVGGFGRYYATPASDFSFFAELGINYMSTNYDLADYKESGFGIALAPGVSYFISSNFALEASIAALSYSTSKPDFDGAENTNNFGLNVDLTNINLGLVYKF
jgi:hypothetical protein